MLVGRAFRRLGGDKYKGENGTVIVIGGSYMYTGAPIFSAMAALRSGADIVYILCDPMAVNTIKSLYEAIVMPLEIIPRILDKATACVIGPGLGRISEETQGIIIKIASHLGHRNVPIILDGDAIHLYKQGIFHDLASIILTPNHNEAINLSVKEGHTCVYKNKVDVIECSGAKTFVFNESSLKRCGGQGDILAGTLATAVSLNPEDLIDACISACEFTRASSKRAFDQKGYSLITSDIFDAMPIILEQIVSSQSSI